MATVIKAQESNTNSNAISPYSHTKPHYCPLKMDGVKN